MNTRRVEPALNLVSFSCPHCGALAHQTWYDVFGEKLEETPTPTDELPFLELMRDPQIPTSQKQRMIEWDLRIKTGEVFLEPCKDDHLGIPQIQNLFVSRCYSCDRIAVWNHDRVVYPRLQNSVFAPNQDLNTDIQADFNEAASILDPSPRGAAALLRLCIQKLCVQLGQPGKHLDTDIAALVQMGLDVHIQQALDIVRVVGNSAVHPGALDLRDDRATASTLFGLVNVIAESLITQPARVKALYAQVVPPSVQAAIKKRDGQP
jgi:Domain of unknown function (DUF4145)